MNNLLQQFRNKLKAAYNKVLNMVKIVVAENNYKEHFEVKNGVGILKYKKHWWSKWRYVFDYETKGLEL